MEENLNFATDNSWCYGNNDSNCQKYGRLYTWDTAMKACPAGWRLPTDSDWEELFQAAGGEDKAGKKLKSNTGWNGTDEFGFSALPGGGARNTSTLRSDVRFNNVGSSGSWWTTRASERHVYYWYISSDDRVGWVGESRDARSSVRCIEN